MILDLDVGNTRCKWRLTGDDGAVIGRGAGTGVPVIEVAGSLRRVRIARVAGETAEWRQWASEQFGIDAEFARSTACACGVSNGYREPERLGVDRWLAVCAAFARERRACVVVDAGTTITADAVAADGRHLGGYIAPGLRLLGGAVVANTAEVVWQSGREAGASVGPGDSTQQAVSAGIAAMAAGFVERALRELTDRLAGQPVVYLTGGDGGRLRPLLPLDVIEAPDLVLEGLGLVLP